MSNIANALKNEISRVARKELRDELKNVKKAVTSYRTQISELKKQVKSLQQEVKRIAKAGTAGIPVASSSDDFQKVRFSPKSLASQRKRLGLSIIATAKILGVSSQSVTNWESGSTRPRASQLTAIASLRKMGKREAAAKLAV